MKKYLQISTVIGIFGLLVLVRQHFGADDKTAVIAPKAQANTSPAQSPTPTPSLASPKTPDLNSITSTATPTPTPSGQYKNGTFTGSVADAFYGNLQVQAIISGGKLTDVVFLQYPNDNNTSLSINSQASGFLKQEAISAQSANVDTISGASASSQAFRQSLADALAQAK